MHEATIAMAILRRAVEAVESRRQCAPANQCSDTSGDTTPSLKVLRIIVNVGEFRNIDSESLEFTFSALRKDFPSTQNTKLEIRPIEAIACCSIANHQFHPAPANCFACTICGGGIDKFLSGKELDIVYIEMEECLSGTAA